MPGMLLALLADAAGVLTLDARERATGCRVAPVEEVTVCAARGVPTTRFPMQLDRTDGVMLIEPSGPRNIMCNLDFILRAGVRGRHLIRSGQVGSTTIVGSRSLASLRIAGRRETVFVGWADGTSVRSADCVASPEVLRSEVTRFVLGPARASARTHVLPYARFDGGRVYAAVPVGEGEIAARFELDHGISVLTAPAARLAAPVLGGSTTGPAYLTMVLYGIVRPVRLFETRKPLMLGGHPIPRLYVRTEDYGSANALRTLDREEAPADDVVASARRTRAGQIALLRVGADALQGCVSITVDDRRRTVTLEC